MPTQKSFKVESAYEKLEKERQERLKELRKDPQLISSVLTIQRYTRGGLERSKFMQIIRERLSYLIFYKVTNLNNLEVLVTFKENPTEFIVNCCGVRENKVFKEARVSKDTFECPEEVLQYMVLEESLREILFHDKPVVYDPVKVKKIQNWWQRLKMVKWLRLNLSEDSMRELVGRSLKLVREKRSEASIFQTTCYYYRVLDKLEFRLIKKGVKKF